MPKKHHRDLALIRNRFVIILAFRDIEMRMRERERERESIKRE
jgi:hypothetical protein